MKTRILTNWKFWLGITLSGTFMVIAFWKVDFPKLWEALLHINFFWLVVGVFTYYINLAIRAIRWGYIFRPVKKVGFWGMYGATIFGYFANNILPVRLGEVARAIYIGLKEGVDKSASLGTIAVERIFDVLSALVLLAIVFYSFPFPEEVVGEWGGYFRQAGGGLLVLSAFGLGFLFFMVIQKERALGMVEFFLRLAPEKLRGSMRDLARSFIDGLSILGNPYHVLVIVLLSAVIWLTSLLPVYFSGIAFNKPEFIFSFSDCLLLLVAGAIAAAIPASPGFVGTFHAGQIMAVLVILSAKAGPGMSRAEWIDWAAAFAIIVHALYLLTTTITGLFILAASGIKFRQISGAEKQTTEGEKK